MKAVLSVIGYEIDSATDNPESRKTSEAPFCTWEEIGEMSDSGAVEIVSHTYGLHLYEHDGRQGGNCADGENLDSFLPSAQKDYVKIMSKISDATGKKAVAMAYPYSKHSETSDIAWLKSGYQLLLGGDNDERRTRINYFVSDAGINRKSAVVRRIARMTGTPVSAYIEAALQEDAY